MDYVFAVCMGDYLSLSAELLFDVNEASKRAQFLTVALGKKHSVIPLKTPSWAGLCGHCGKHWTPALTAPEFCEGTKA